MRNVIEHRDIRDLIYTKRADNVRIVDHPVAGKVYVCPYPPSHFDSLRDEARGLRLKIRRPLSLSK